MTFELPDALLDDFAARVAAELTKHDLARPSTIAPEEPWRLLSVDEAAKRLGRSTRWVRDHRHEIGWVRLDGGALAFRLEDLQRFANERLIAGERWRQDAEPLHPAASA